MGFEETIRGLQGRWSLATRSHSVLSYRTLGIWMNAPWTQFPCWQSEGVPNTFVVVVQLLSHVRFFVTPWTAHARLSCPSLSPGVWSNSCPSIQ